MPLTREACWQFLYIADRALCLLITKNHLKSRCVKTSQEFLEQFRSVVLKIQSFAGNSCQKARPNVDKFGNTNSWAYTLLAPNVPVGEDCHLKVSMAYSGERLQGFSGALSRLNSIRSLLHPVDRYRTPSAIVRLGGPISPHLASTCRQELSTASF